MIEWDNTYSVGISIIDEEHKKLIDIMNKVAVTKRYNGNPEEVQGELLEVLSEMKNYAFTHFANEETYMKEFNCSEYHSHKKEHQDFSYAVTGFGIIVNNGENAIIDEIFELLQRWLVYHILGTDKKLIGCFKENGFL